MKASCSLWSADLLSLKSSIELVSKRADEFHIDAMHGFQESEAAESTRFARSKLQEVSVHAFP
jgi:pentose-5-phosphate-3-epimerase